MKMLNILWSTYSHYSFISKIFIYFPFTISPPLFFLHGGRVYMYKNDGHACMSWEEWKKKHFYFISFKPQLGFSLWALWQNAISLCHFEFRITLCNFIYLYKAQDIYIFFFKETNYSYFILTSYCTEERMNK